MIMPVMRVRGDSAPCDCAPCDWRNGLQDSAHKRACQRESESASCRWLSPAGLRTLMHPHRGAGDGKDLSQCADGSMALMCPHAAVCPPHDS